MLMSRKQYNVGGFFMEIEGNDRVILSGCQGIQTYTEDEVCLRTPFGQVALYGTHLVRGCMTVEGATVTGGLQRIEFR